MLLCRVWIAVVGNGGRNGDGMMKEKDEGYGEKIHESSVMFMNSDTAATFTVTATVPMFVTIQRTRTSHDCKSLSLLMGEKGLLLL